MHFSVARCSARRLLKASGPVEKIGVARSRQAGTATTYYGPLMATLRFRTDAEVDAALASLATGGGDRSTVIREAILAAWRTQQAERLRAEAEALAADEDDVREARAVLQELESLRA